MPPISRRPEELPPVHIELTEDQKKAIADYVKATGHMPVVGLHVEVVEGKIAPAAVAIGAA